MANEMLRQKESAASNVFEKIPLGSQGQVMTMGAEKPTFEDPDVSDVLVLSETNRQTVTGEIEFLQEIIVPPSSVILGAGGASLSSSARAFQFRDAFQGNQYFPFFEVKSTGNTPPKYYRPGDEFTAPVNPDSGVTLTDPQEMAFSTSAANTLTVAFIVKPVTMGTLTVETWVGGDDTGAVLVKNTFEIGAAQLNTEMLLVLPNPTMLFLGDAIFSRFSGVQLDGAIQSSGPFQGELKPFLKSCLHLLTPIELVLDDDSRLTDDRAPLSHTHTGSEITDLDTILAGKKDDFSENTAFNKLFGVGSDQVCEGNDSRLIFGNEYDYASSEGQSDNSTTTPATKLTLSTADLPAGDYKISWSFEVTNNTNGKPVDFEIFLDGSTTLNDGEFAPSNGGQYLPVTGYKCETLSGTHDIHIEYNRTSGGGGIASIRRALY